MTPDKGQMSKYEWIPEMSELGKQCQHGGLERQCLICELEFSLAHSQAEAMKLEAKWKGAEKELAQARKEIAILRSERNEAQKWANKHAKDCNKLEAERDRYRRELEDILNAHSLGYSLEPMLKSAQQALEGGKQ